MRLMSLLYAKESTTLLDRLTVSAGALGAVWVVRRSLAGIALGSLSKVIATAAGAVVAFATSPGDPSIGFTLVALGGGAASGCADSPTSLLAAAAALIGAAAAAPPVDAARSGFAAAISMAIVGFTAGCVGAVAMQEREQEREREREQEREQEREHDQDPRAAELQEQIEVAYDRARQGGAAPEHLEAAEAAEAIGPFESVD